MATGICPVSLGDAAVFGSERNRMVAELFIEYTWKKNEWLDSEMKSVKYFDKIVGMKA
jgi:acyl-CoA dehydrogenase